MSAILEPIVIVPKASPAAGVCASQRMGTDGCPMTGGGACPTDQRVIDKCNEC